MEIREFIKTYCNPVTANDLIETIDLFEDIDYDEYIADINDIAEVELNNDINNVPMLIHNILLKHLINVLFEIGFVINQNMLNLRISELNDILEFLVDINFSSKEDSEFILNTLNINDDIICGFAIVLNKYTAINMTKLFDIIDDINSSYIKDLEDTLEDIINGDTDDINNYDLVSIIRELKVNVNQDIVALHILRDPYEEESTLMDYIRNYINKLYGNDYIETAINIVSLIILSSDYRFDIIKGYTDVVENIIEDENTKTNIYNHIKKLEPIVQALYTKYNIGVNNE